jgi:signal transduction histidine kinase
MKSSLRTRLILSFVLIIVATMGSFSLAGRSTINQWFNRMMVQMGREYAERAAQIFGWYYVNYDSWEGVEDVLVDFRRLPGNAPWPSAQGEAPSQNAQPLGTGRMPWGNILPPRDERLLLVDAGGELVYDSNPDGGAADELLANLTAGVQIVVDGERVGTVIAASSAGILNTFQEAYLRNVNRFVLVGGIGAILVAITWGAWTSVRILRPVKALSEASRKLAQGDYSQRIPIITDDELGEMTNSFNQMAAELERQEMLRRRGLADVAHELRTPLTVLQVDLESIEDGIIAADAETIQRLQLEVGTLRNLVEDLRILSLADAGELKLDLQPVDLGGLLQINVKRMQRQAAEKGIGVGTELPEDELMVVGDEQRLSQVLMNLLANALQFTQSGGTIRATALQAGSQARVAIADTGEGISAADLPHVFERLYRSDQARARQNGGSGLGLSIARSLVEAQGGKIWVESSPGQGSTFICEFPLA